MEPLALQHVYTYTDADRAFWEEHLEDWLPRKIIDGHVHFSDRRFQIETETEEMLRSYWVWEVYQVSDAETMARCAQITLPGRKVSFVAFGNPTLGWEVEGSNEYVREECVKRGWYTLVITRPTWVAEQLDWLLSQTGVIGVKPFYTMLGFSRDPRNGHLETSIFEFLPHHQLEVLDARRAWITMHVPKTGRLGDPGNQRDIRELRKRYPKTKLVIAHLGRCYTEPHAIEGLLPFADDPGIYFDTSMVLNPAVHFLALKHIGPGRLIYGSDNPVGFMRGRRYCVGRSYINRTNYPFHWNTEREPAAVEERYTLYMYEDLKAIKDSCERLGFGTEEVNALFHHNARRLIDDVLAG